MDIDIYIAANKMEIELATDVNLTDKELLAS